MKVNDINIYYEVHGDGTPLVMIMGLSANIDWWNPVLLEASSKNFKTIIFDNRGAGRSDAPDIEYSIKMFADDTVGLMDALDVEKAHVLGASMGGMIAQELVLNYPERVEKLVLCCTSCGGSKSIPPSPEVMELLMRDTKGLTQEEIARGVIPLLYTEEFIEGNPDYVEETVQNILKHLIQEYALQRQIKAIMRFNTARRLKKINTSTLIVNGKKDILAPPQNAEVLAKLIPEAKLLLLDNSAHSLFQPEPEKLAKKILEFLKE
ncbi:MAG: alpha/beta fold hydrolase [Promethearchaeota archaeon]